MNKAKKPTRRDAMRGLAYAAASAMIPIKPSSAIPRGQVEIRIGNRPPFLVDAESFDGPWKSSRRVYYKEFSLNGRVFPISWEGPPGSVVELVWPDGKVVGS